MEANQPTLSVRSYERLDQYLRDQLSGMRERNPSFSLRAWAQRMGLRSHGVLQKAVAGTHGLPLKHVHRLGQSLGLGEEDTAHLEVLAQLQGCKDTNERLYLTEKLNRSLQASGRPSFAIINNHRFYSNPLHGVLRSLIRRSDFRYDLSWIQAQLAWEVSQHEIGHALKLLMEIGFVEEREGILFNIKGPVCTQADLPSQAMKTFHKRLLAQSAEALDEQESEEREFNSYSLNLRPEDLPKVKGEIREFIQNLLAKYENHQESETYQLGVQLFRTASKESL